MGFLGHVRGDSRFHSVLVGVHAVVVEHGLRGLTLRATARKMRMSPATINQFYGSWDRALGLITQETAEIMRLGWQGELWADPDLLTMLIHLLPDEADDLRALRVWLALVEAGRATPEIGAAVAAYDADRVQALSYVLRRQGSSRVLVTLCLAVVDGLGVALTRPEDPITREQAVEVVRCLATLMSRGGAGGSAVA